MLRLYTVLLGISALVISGVGATFSVTGLAKLFAGAPLAVMVMAGALEFAKIVCAAFLHRSWDDLPRFLKFYLTSAVLILIGITSMGIFGHLSHAYQATSEKLKAVEVRIESFVAEDQKVNEELRRLEGAIQAIPENRVTRRLELQKELEPRFQTLKKQALDINIRTRELNLQKLSYQTEIGPIIYVARTFGRDSDEVARWLIFVFVLVFDPLAVCLVIATSFSIKYREIEIKKLALAKKKEAAEEAAMIAATAAAAAEAATRAAATPINVAPPAVAETVPAESPSTSDNPNIRAVG
jgi:hypothetical protein